MIVRQLKAAGIAVSLLERDYASYVAAVQANQFQLYLGEVKILNNMDFTQLVVPGGSAAFGVTPRTATSEETVPTENTEPQPTPLSDIIAGFYSGTQTVSDLAGALLTEMPVIPVCYRKGLLFYSADLRSVTSATPSDLFLSMAQF